MNPQHPPAPPPLPGEEIIRLLQEIRDELRHQRTDQRQVIDRAREKLRNTLWWIHTVWWILMIFVLFFTTIILTSAAGPFFKTL